MALTNRYLSATNHINPSPDPPPEAKSATAQPLASGVRADSDFVVIPAAMLCALICFLGLCGFARCGRQRSGAASLPARPHPSANRGLKKKVLQSLPKFAYAAAAAENGGRQLPADCAICLADYADGDEIRTLPQCGHAFHVQCIDTWLGSHSSCPSCRRILVVGRCQNCGGGEFPKVSVAGDGSRAGTPFGGSLPQMV
ncbi:hypothetical protein DM860_004724 [Cuscuta australis]|uniref:RING-type E3 ubiquitin transferase n=1 Tax=Cuscuta australis TaxID=267555 RepID=A0A328DL78_9ASTE|nr:hypothetical protein DM860_004724 [Cuscuta australis]